MASGSADQALSPEAISFVVAGKTWKVGDEIHSTGVGAIEKRKWFKLLELHTPLHGLKESSWVGGLVRNFVSNGPI